ncbi:MAG: LCP family protein [Pseudonocardiales bacterium]|nr:LCP family protein [Pseudonocardiales bacterium]
MSTRRPPGAVCGPGAGAGETMRARRVAVRVVQGAVALASVLVLVATGYGYAVVRQVSDGLVTSEALGEPAPPRGLDEAFTALLVGIDSRTDAAGNPLPPAVLAELRAGEDEGQFNTDTIILLHVPAGPDPGASAISIPRDAFVLIAGTDRPHKINSAYRRGMDTVEGTERQQREAGRQVLVRTVEQLTGIEVDHFAEINLAGFVEITEAIGGIPVCLNAPVREERSGVDLPAGYQLVSGADALAFVRQRRDLPGGDLDRVTRQQAFLAGVARSALGGTLSDPAGLNQLVATVTRYVVLDRGWDLDRLVAQLRRAAGRDIAFRTIPTGRPDLVTPVDGVAVEVDPEQVREFVAGIVGPDDVRLSGPSASTPTPTPTEQGAPPTVRSTPVPLGPAATSPATSPAAGATGSATPAPADITAASVPCVD